MNIDKVAERVRAEFDEMPELMLTPAQASRFFGLDQEITQSVMNRLVDADYLKKTRDGALVKVKR